MKKILSFFALSAIVLGMASCGDGNEPSNVSFNIQVKDLDAFSGTVCINPSNKDVWYFWGGDTKANFYANSEDAKTVINTMMAKKKNELKEDGMTFEQYLEWMKKQGNIEGFTKGYHEKEISSFDPGKEYVVYACIVNKDAEVVGKVTTHEFTTSDTGE